METAKQWGWDLVWGISGVCGEWIEGQGNRARGGLRGRESSQMDEAPTLILFCRAFLTLHRGRRMQEDPGVAEEERVAAEEVLHF